MTVTTRMVVLAVACAVGGCDIDAGLEAADPPALAAERTYWHAGTFRYLPAVRADLVDLVDGFDHPNAGGFGRVSATRAARFEEFVEALFQAIDDGFSDGQAGDWCGVRTLADAAGYDVRRLHDAGSGRWMVYAADRTSHGQAYFVVNPRAQRNLVIEAPHVPADAYTGVQAARIFRELTARVLIVNKEHRCSDPDPTGCDGVTSSCGGAYRESDPAHHTENTFHILHAWLSDHQPGARFAQLHGFTGSATDRAEISDSTTNDVDPRSVSVAFARNLDAYVPEPTAVDSCQQYAGEPPRARCGTTNVQGRYTNGRTADACTASTTASSGRFLHIEQDKTLRDDDPSDGWWWGQVRDALRDTWPACDLGGGGTRCGPGPRQSDYADCTCGQPCP